MTSRSPVEVWLVDLERHGNALARIAHRDGVLSAEDHRRILSYRRPADRVAFAASRAALRHVLDRHGVPAGKRLYRARSGKPLVAGQLAFSISHTRSHVAIAVNREGSVGVDIETIGRDVPGHPFIARVAAVLGDEWSLAHLPLAAWTIVEAWTKLHGLTLADVLDSPGRGRELAAAIETNASEIHLVPLDLPAGLVGACWYEGPITSIAVRDLELGVELAGTHSYPKALA